MCVCACLVSVFEWFSFSETCSRVVEVGEYAVLAFEEVVVVPVGLEEVRVGVLGGGPHEVAVLAHALLHVCHVLVQQAHDQSRSPLVWLVADYVVRHR